MIPGHHISKVEEFVLESDPDKVLFGDFTVIIRHTREDLLVQIHLVDSENILELLQSDFTRLGFIPLLK